MAEKLIPVMVYGAIGLIVLTLALIALGAIIDAAREGRAQWQRRRVDRFDAKVAAYKAAKGQGAE